MSAAASKVHYQGAARLHEIQQTTFLHNIRLRESPKLNAWDVFTFANVATRKLQIADARDVHHSRRSATLKKVLGRNKSFCIVMAIGEEFLYHRTCPAFREQFQDRECNTEDEHITGERTNVEYIPPSKFSHAFNSEIPMRKKKATELSSNSLSGRDVIIVVVVVFVVLVVVVAIIIHAEHVQVVFLEIAYTEELKIVQISVDNSVSPGIVVLTPSAWRAAFRDSMPYP